MADNRRKGKLKHRRKRPFKIPKDTFLIVCEGKNTEPFYFNSFRLKSATVKTITYTNKGNAVNFVNAAIEYKEQFRNEYDQVWVVFDKDENSNRNFNEAIRLAILNNLLVAYSNQAFEFWYLLHFNYHHCRMHRNTYKVRLNRLLPFEYNKEENTAKRMYDALIENQPFAIENASRLYDEIGDHRSPAVEESSTTVHKLVVELNKHL